MQDAFYDRYRQIPKISADDPVVLDDYRQGVKLWLEGSRNLDSDLEAQVARDYSRYNKMLKEFSEAKGVRLPEIRFEIDLPGIS